MWTARPAPLSRPLVGRRDKYTRVRDVSSGGRQFAAGRRNSGLQHAEDHEQDEREDQGDQQRAEAAEPVREEEEHPTALPGRHPGNARPPGAITNGFQNVYLDAISAAEGSPPEGGNTDPDEVAWNTAVEAAPWVLGSREPEREIAPEELYEKLEPFKRLVADDIREGPKDDD